jgi:phosphoribosylformimino-5-aminoimidazole carboxamide ribotide isomerase
LSAFELIPAIDLLGGKCVRLSQGRYDRVTVYQDDPSRVAADFASHPLRRLHVVDLDGARAGRPCNRPAVSAILREVGSIPVELGGGIRTLESVEAWLELGIDRVILGTAALRSPELVREAGARFPGRIGVGIDARDGRVAVEGWLETSEVDAVEVAERFENAGVAAIIHTDIARDGMQSGPNFEATAKLATAVEIPVIASGGVGSEDDVRAAVRHAGQGISGLIVGRALYTGAVDLARALEIAACC